MRDILKKWLPAKETKGKAESAVKITKNLLKKALRDGRDPWLALLEYRNTPVETIE